MRKVRDEVTTSTLAASLVLTLPFPPSANEYWKPAPGRGPVPSTEAKRYKAAVAKLAAAHGLLPLAGPVSVTLTAYRPRRSGDLDNMLKVMNDALNEVAWLDDDQVVHISATRADDAANPRVELHATAERFATREEAEAHKAAREERARRTRETRNRNRKLREAGELPPKAPKKSKLKAPAKPAPLPQHALPLESAASPAYKTPLPPSSRAGTPSYGSRHAEELRAAAQPKGLRRLVRNMREGKALNLSSASYPPVKP